MKFKELRRRAADLIKASGWDVSGRDGVDMLQAICRTSPRGDEEWQLLVDAREVMDELCGELGLEARSDLIEWEYADGRTKADVVSALVGAHQLQELGV